MESRRTKATYLVWPLYEPIQWIKNFIFLKKLANSEQLPPFDKQILYGNRLVNKFEASETLTWFTLGLINFYRV